MDSVMHTETGAAKEAGEVLTDKKENAKDEEPAADGIYRNARQILIVSDTHCHLENLETVLKRVGTPDLLIHLGDSEGGREQIRRMSGCPTEMVAGNCDFLTGLPEERVIEIGMYRAFLTHGHRYSVSYDNDRLKQAALSRGCQIAMFGHTHVAELVQEDGVTMLNPGSLTKPRPFNAAPSYILMEIDREGQAHYTICRLEHV